mmetsp:Transcript_5700/g.14732  ORF Transcript_5700/g.14732 Transcript_5700/m.14732 type:complete len:255 (-) Transcript_5700:56-820(-)
MAITAQRTKLQTGARSKPRRMARRLVKLAVTASSAKARTIPSGRRATWMPNQPAKKGRQAEVAARRKKVQRHELVGEPGAAEDDHRRQRTQAALLNPLCPLAVEAAEASEDVARNVASRGILPRIQEKGHDPRIPAADAEKPDDIEHLHGLVRHRRNVRSPAEQVEHGQGTDGNDVVNRRRQPPYPPASRDERQPDRRRNRPEKGSRREQYVADLFSKDHERHDDADEKEPLEPFVLAIIFVLVTARSSGRFAI